MRQLLTHTGGIAEVLHPVDAFKPLFGEIVKAGDGPQEPSPSPPLPPHAAACANDVV